MIKLNRRFDSILRYFNPSLRISLNFALCLSHFIFSYLSISSPFLFRIWLECQTPPASAVPFSWASFVLHIGRFKFVCPLQIIIAGCFVIEQWTAAYLFSIGFQLVFQRSEKKMYWNSQIGQSSWQRNFEEEFWENS